MSESRVRENRMPGLKRRGLETERQTGITATGVAQPTGKPAEHEGPRTYHTGEATAPVPDPTQWLARRLLLPSLDAIDVDRDRSAFAVTQGVDRIDGQRLGADDLEVADCQRKWLRRRRTVYQFAYPKAIVHRRGVRWQRDVVLVGDPDEP